MPSKGIVIITYGDGASNVALRLLASLSGQYAVTVHDSPIDGYDNKQMSRYAKTTLLDWSPYDYTLYLDADTIVYGDVAAGFDVLKSGWDLAMAPSRQQGDNVLWHIDQEERLFTLDLFHFVPLQLQAGVFFVVKNERTFRLFEGWHEEWLLYEQNDQAALLRAFYRFPVRLWLLGHPWNGGAVIGHRFGAIANES